MSLIQRCPYFWGPLRGVPLYVYMYMHVDVCVVCVVSEVLLQLWMMKGQIEEQQGNTDTARENYSAGVSII